MCDVFCIHLKPQQANHPYFEHSNDRQTQEKDNSSWLFVKKDIFLSSNLLSK